MAWSQGGSLEINLDDLKMRYFRADAFVIASPGFFFVKNM